MGSIIIIFSEIFKKKKKSEELVPIRVKMSESCASLYSNRAIYLW